MINTSQPMKGITRISLSLVFSLVGLTGCSASDSYSEPGTVANSYSYDVGYELGTSGSIGQMIFYGQSDNPTSACKFVLEMSALGTTNDGIDWATLDSDEFLSGCLDGVDIAHPDADWNQ